MAATRLSITWRDNVDYTEIIEEWVVDTHPGHAQNDPALPQGYDRHDNYPSCRVVSREIRVQKRGSDSNKSRATIRYSNQQSEATPPDNPAILIHDMMGRTQRQMVDITDPSQGIGMNHEGVEVYRPNMEIIYEHYESSFDEATILDLTGKINDAAWNGYAAKSMLFLGCRTRQQKPNRIRVTYHFLYDDNEHLAEWYPYEEKKVTVSGVTFTGRDYKDLKENVVYQTGDFDRLPI